VDPSVEVINFCRTPQWFVPRVSYLLSPVRCDMSLIFLPHRAIIVILPGSNGCLPMSHLSYGGTGTRSWQGFVSLLVSVPLQIFQFR
jgi:hypothetical protein